MNFTAHIAVGSAVGFATKNPYLGFAAGMISHQVIDAIPHIDPGSIGANSENIFKNKPALIWVFTDIIIGISLFWFILNQLDFASFVLWGAIGGISTDVIDNSPFWSKKLCVIFPFNHFHFIHEKIHYTIENKKYFWVGILTQLILIFASLFFMFNF